MWAGRRGGGTRPRQDGIRAQLQQRRDTLRGEGTQAVMEAHSLADVPHPVLRVLEQAGLGQFT
ncbi:hypothetical protein, partial [Streptomyces aurantiacus]|uniref:hypothetical protein n=1 Tax=Streptomyces aurantiacus TaxID=47760 RepID=UPI00193A2457